MAIYYMRHAATEGEKEHWHDTKQFITRHFYVDDGLASTATPEEAADAQLASNNHRAKAAFPANKRAKNLKDVDLKQDEPPQQRSLGVLRNLETKSFMFQVSTQKRP